MGPSKISIAKISIALAITLGSSGQVYAENWVTVYEEEPIWATVDKDSIRRGSDGLVYFRSDGPNKADHAADCQRGITYLLKLYVMNGLEYPNWRNEGSAVVPRSAGEAALRYACANA